MYAKVYSCALMGLSAQKITVETDISFGFPALNIVGLPDTAVRESKERVRAAIINSAFRFPDKRVTVNLSPADIRKEGSHLDLAVAVSIMLSAGLIKMIKMDSVAFIGELKLDGSINGINGILPMLLGLKDNGIDDVFIPYANRKEAAKVADINIFPLKNLQELGRHMEGEEKIKPLTYDTAVEILKEYHLDFEDVTGQESVKRGLQIAASAMHNVLMIGSPGSGKTMMAERLPSIMPPLSSEEIQVLTKIYSISGLLSEDKPVVLERPFRMPDHTATAATLIGGGRKPRPGEVSLAHLGVLFLDEAAEFSRVALEALRKPMEDECCTINRVYGSITLPAKFLTIAATNPCKCGYYGDERHECTCSIGSIRRYRSRLSGPFLDRIDIMLNVKSAKYEEINSNKKGTSSNSLRKGVILARKIQDERFKDEKISYNSQMNLSQIKKYCHLDGASESLIYQAFNQLNLSIRSYNKILKVSRTIADISGSENIRKEHVAEAISYKCELENI